MNFLELLNKLSDAFIKDFEATGGLLIIFILLKSGQSLLHKQLISKILKKLQNIYSC